MSDEEWLPFPDVDVEQILVRCRDCLAAILGPVPRHLVEEMKRRDFDYAPVLRSADGNAAVLGLIPRCRLEELLSEGRDLTEDDAGIHGGREFQEVWVHSSLAELLRKMAERPVWMVEYEGDAGEYGPFYLSYGIVTRSDLNKHPIRILVYEILAKLETALADLVRGCVSDHLQWIQRLSEENQARILGYWELSKLRGVDTGPVAGATLADLLNVVARDESLRRRLGYDSRSSFEEAVGSIPSVRNQVMHPVRPLVTDAESCLHLKTVLREAIRLTERLRTRPSGEERGQIGVHRRDHT